MRRLHLPRAFLVGALAALLVGGAAATLVTSTKHKVNDAPLLVPVGRVGDRVVYSVFQGGPDAETRWSKDGLFAAADALTRRTDAPTVSFGGLRSGGARTFVVDSVVSALDAAGVRHEAVIVLHNDTLPGVPTDHRVLEIIDLVTRSTFRIDDNLQIVALNGGGTRLEAGDVQTSRLEVREPVLPGLGLQGRALSLGQVLRDEDVAVPASLTGSVRGVHVRQWVADRALVDGIDAYGVRYEATYHAVPGVPIDPDVSLAKGIGAPAEVAVRAWRVDWMGADHPYAVLREQGAALDGADAPGQHLAYRFLQSTQGAAFIPWPLAAGGHWTDARTDLERTSGARRYPAMGTGSSLPLSIDAALQRVESDLFAPTFNVWHRAHPAASLVAAVFSNEKDLGTNLVYQQWRFTFAEPNGDGHTVVARRDANTATLSIKDEADARVLPWSPNDFPENPPTFAALERVWDAYVSASASSQPFDYARWGLDSGSDRCTVPSMAPLAARQSAALMYGGHSVTGGCPGWAGNPGSVATLDARSGRTQEAFESHFAHPFRGATVAPDEARRGWAMAKSTVPRGLSSPTPAAATGTTLGILGLFFAAYFWPALKFAATRLTVLPGYVKVRKEDLLNNPVRENVLRLIRTTPGIHASDIARQANAGWGTVVYHLSVLEKNKVVTSLVDGRHKRFFPADSVDYGKRGQLAALMNANTRSIYDMIEATPGIIQGELAGRSGLTVPTIIWHLQRLEEAGLVGRDKSGRRFHYFANPVYEPKRPARADEAMEVQ